MDIFVSNATCPSRLVHASNDPAASCHWPGVFLHILDVYQALRALQGWNCHNNNTVWLKKFHMWLLLLHISPPQNNIGRPEWKHLYFSWFWAVALAAVLCVLTWLCRHHARTSFFMPDAHCIHLNGCWGGNNCNAAIALKALSAPWKLARLGVQLFQL